MLLISHRFHDLILRIIEARLLKAASLDDHTLVLDVSHPTTNTPYIFCHYLGSGSPTRIEDTASNDESTSKLGRLANIYSHFRPLLPEKDRTSIKLHPAGGLFIGQPSGVVDSETGYACQDIHLESHELFSQLCTYTNLVKVSNSRGLLQTSVGISDGVIRVWRNWLAGRCGASVENSSCDTRPGTSKGIDGEEVKDGLLWADNKKHVGLRMSVIEKQNPDQFVVDSPEEDAFVSYVLQYEGMSLLYPTHHDAKMF